MVVNMENSRWQCSVCNSKNVQVSLLAWHYETKDKELIYVDSLTESAIVGWVCCDCGEGDWHSPKEVKQESA